MIEYTKVKSPQDIKVGGYKDLGIHIKGDLTMERLVKTANRGKIDLVVLVMGDDDMYQLFVKGM